MSGRFSQWRQADDGRKESYLHSVEGGASAAEALQAAGVDQRTVRGWLGSDPEFAEAVRAARTRPRGEPRYWNMADIDAGPAVLGERPDAWSRHQPPPLDDYSGVRGLTWLGKI